MARILLSFSAHLYFEGSFQLGCFYSGLIKAMKDEGNELLIMNSAEFLHNSWNCMAQNLPTYFNKENIVTTVKNFNPDLVITFNHCIPIEVEEACNCPIIIWDVDSVDYLSDKSYIKSHIDRYTFFDLSKDGAQQAVKQLGAKPDKVHVVRAATSIQAQSSIIEQNIAFIGNPFYCPAKIMPLLQTEDIEMVRAATNTMAADFNADPRTIIPAQDLAKLEKYMPLGQLKALFSGQERITVLNSIADLDLRIWGPSSWLDIAPYLPRVAMSYNKAPAYSLEHNQHIYNSSKICLSIAHAQATDGFPWRIMDIMASNGCLVSDYHSGINDFVKDYIDLPMFTDSYGARNLCKELLSNETLRNEIVTASQKCIEDKGRWHHRFKEIEDIMSVPLLAQSKPISANTPAPIHIRKVDNLKARYTVYQNTLTNIAQIVPTPLLHFGYKVLHVLFNFRLDQQIISEVKFRSTSKKTLRNLILRWTH